MSKRAGPKSPRLRLDTVFQPAQDAFVFTITNLTDAPLLELTLGLSSLVRLMRQAHVDGAVFLRRFGNLHIFQIAGPVAPGASLKFSAKGLSHAPRHITDGPKSAYMIAKGGDAEPVAMGDLIAEGLETRGPLRAALPSGPASILALTPWPARFDVSQEQTAITGFAPESQNDAQAAQVEAINQLEERLFGSRSFVPGVWRLQISQDDSFGDGYKIDFEANGAQLSYGKAKHLRYGLITLAQMTRGGRLGYAVAKAGVIEDTPRFSWRGLQVDVARHFRPIADILRIIDICAWLKLNVLHLHLTDDEAWRLEIDTLPELTEYGAWRGPNETLLPQHGFCDQRYGGYYTKADIASIVAHGQALGVRIVPEIDIPGHATAVMAALPHLRDPDEVMDSYRSVQGYPNPALNPALPQTYDFLEKILAQVTALFPDKIVHLGGDEVPADAWHSSPLAKTFCASHGYDNPISLHGHLMRWAEGELSNAGRRMGGWDELGACEGLDNPLLFAWQDRERVAALTGAGFDVIATPGSSYYLDMAQSDGWDEPGLSWAGTVSAKDTYSYDPIEGLGTANIARLKGVQACLWSENIVSKKLFDHMVFPRLGAVAETGWSPNSVKNYARFENLAALLPKLERE